MGTFLRKAHGRLHARLTLTHLSPRSLFLPAVSRILILGCAVFCDDTNTLPAGGVASSEWGVGRLLQPDDAQMQKDWQGLILRNAKGPDINILIIGGTGMIGGHAGGGCVPSAALFSG